MQGGLQRVCFSPKFNGAIVKAAACVIPWEHPQLLFATALSVVLIPASILLSSGDILAGGLVAGSYAIIGSYRTRRSADFPFAGLVVLVTVYHLVAVLNSFYVELPGNRPDSETFHGIAASIAEQAEFRFGPDYVFYVNFLAAVYFVTSPSYILASELSVFAMLSSLLVLERILELHRVPARGWLVLVVGIIPSYVMIGPAPMREAWELMFLVLTLYFGLQIAAKPGTKEIAGLFASAFIFGMLHKGMLFAGIAIALVSIVIAISTRGVALSRGEMLRLGMPFGILVGAVVSVIYLTEAGLALVSGLLDKDFFWTIWHYRTSVDNIGAPRTAYGIEFEFGSTTQAVLSTLSAYGYYLFYPLSPITDSQPADLYAIFETWVRLVLIAAIVVTWLRAGWRAPPFAWLLAASYLVLTFIWALGTTNYGQAIRHHILTNWILVVLTGYLIFRVARPVAGVR